MSQSLQLDKLLVYILLLILKYEANFKHSKDRRNGLQWLNAFVVIEQLLILLSFSKENICLPNGLLLPILIEGWRFLVQTKAGPAIFTVWSGFDDALSQSHEKKRMVVGGFWDGNHVTFGFYPPLSGTQDYSTTSYSSYLFGPSNALCPSNLLRFFKLWFREFKNLNGYWALLELLLVLMYWEDGGALDYCPLIPTKSYSTSSAATSTGTNSSHFYFTNSRQLHHWPRIIQLGASNQFLPQCWSIPQDRLCFTIRSSTNK